MCGINGFLDFSAKYDNDEINAIVLGMNDRIIHRGPDDFGIAVMDGIGLGMRRLSIIDLKSGIQPIYNDDKTMVIVFNGEIYNYKVLKVDLIHKGHMFHTESDTEVILRCYMEYGTECFNKLKGMFAFAIYDFKNQKLTLARDRAGEKPLYYYIDPEKMFFSSELKSMTKNSYFPKKIFPKALNQYLQLTYIPAPLTIFENVYKLLPGHYAEIEIDGQMKITQYWDVVYNDHELIQDYDKCKTALRKTLFNAVEETMVADVPIGTLLSGGIDSTIITGIASKISNKPLDSFTIGYNDKQYDESTRAKIASEMHGTNHHLFILNYENVIPELDSLINNLDEPFADSSYIPTYMISKYASQYVKTVLSGDSGDELFGGYSKYLIGYYAEKYNRIPRFYRNVFQKSVSAFPDNSSLTRKIRKVIENSDKSIFDQRKSLMCLGFKDHELSQLLNERYINKNALEFIDNYYVSQVLTDNELSSALYTDFKVVLEGDMLAKVDRASMLASLESRVPMLHKDVIELASKIPSQYKINTSNTKIILKDTFRDLIPDILLNKSKKGFSVPIGKWFRNELKQDLLNELQERKIQEQGVFNYEFIHKILQEHFNMTKNRDSELWTLYIFQKWYKLQFEGK